ncbi:MAG: signal peptidase I [Microcoleus sp. PH2017_07_MST_O_A]|uniref:signal peptidase I n=1 Tax=unclassified Microcoleus TaxID=2642155 RepID=UPI001D2F0FA9|nr:MULTISPECIES: signal peptidase I [unclassified Microcoleus]MCC3421153.1 signal peptidase I [Microcoleus sp. PH2017_07_MST_O_A]MCC3509476.1 signal peptidase I [Microcoleus sp. PH2017_17_BER_D_A]TAE51911.1 MAG: signal peptidase I [Oscillatoriales cyanobacterium]MCC3456142.1 signal peptidase I [Microcoleus sp. PH2017_08_TRC_O_A]MCC3474728.1 signal peptidase I [Microcoleus sp. PH2017_13_LAR_U_A]
MPPEVIFGNAGAEGASRGGWFAGHFIMPEDDARSTSALEVKWGVHSAGDCRTQWAVNAAATTLSILVKGRFRLQFPSQEILLCCEADYALWLPGVPHYWSAEEDSVIVTVRWPSVSGDSSAIKN